jgi:hypothetical protein
MKLIITIEDPTNWIGVENAWWWEGTSPEVFLETKKIWIDTIKNLNDPDISIWFHQIDPNIHEDEIIIDYSNNMIKSYQKSNDRSLWLKRTISSFNAIDINFEYDFLLATTLGCFWQFDLLKIILEGLPKTGVYTGKINTNASSPYVAGSGKIFSRDVVKILLSQKEHMYNFREWWEDVEIGRFLITEGINAIDQDWMVNINDDNISNADTVIEDSYKRGIIHFRVKYSRDRLNVDPIILSKIKTYKMGLSSI